MPTKNGKRTVKPRSRPRIAGVFWTIMASLSKTVLMVFRKADSADLMDARALLHAAEPLRIGNGSHQGARHFHR